MLRAAACMALLLLGTASAKAQQEEGSSADSIRLTVSRETTFLTEPLDEQGWVDYASALEKQMSQGVTPENNAAVLLWQALGPREIQEAQREDFIRRLGIAPLPADGEYFVDLFRFLPVPPLGVNPNDWHTLFHERILQAIRRPWNAQEFREIAEWIEANQLPLSLIKSALERPEYYSPPQFIAGSRRLVDVLLPHVQESRAMAQALLARGMRHLADGRVDDAWSDVMFTHLLARLVARGPFLVERLVGTAIESMACAADVAILRAPGLSETQTRTFLADLNSLSPLLDTAQVIDRTERYSLLDAYSHVVRARDARLPVAVTENTEIQQIFTRLLGTPAACDWDEPLKVCNQWFDRVVRAMGITSRRQRVQELKRLSDELGALRDNTADSRILEDRLAIADRKERGAIIGELLTATLMTSFVQARETQDRVTARIRLSRLGMALACHRAEHGRFPARLDELKPPIVVPGLTDPFTDKTFVYKSDENGFVLYSLGSNEQDDDGRTYGEGEGVDDLVVRVPEELPE